MAEHEEGSTQDFIPTEQGDVPAENDAVTEPEEGDEDIIQKYNLGFHGPWWASPEKTYLSDDLEADVRSALITLRQLASRSDIAARRFEVEQTWEVELFQRGYQHLDERRGGGFDLPGEDTRWGPTAQINRSNLLNCNIISKVHDILVGALCREVPRVQFLPSCPSNIPEVTASQVANKYKFVYQRNNKIRELMRDIASKFCTDDRVALLTAYWLDGSVYGFEEDEEEPVSPETETTELGEMQETAQTKPEDDEEEGEETPEQEQAEPAAEQAEEPEELPIQPKKRMPKGMERTTSFGKLANKVPITSKDIITMPWIQLFEDLDEAFVKAMFPFAKDRIKPEGVDSAEIELDRIARLNTNLAIQGKYVTGDSLQRLCTVCYTFMRPSLFYANEVKSEVSDKLKELFPDGALVITAGSEMMFARNCIMQDHVVIGHPCAGNGQNRIALLTNIVPIQKRLNDWMDLMGDFFVRTVPKRYYDQVAFDIELIQSQDNTPGGSIPFIARPGMPFTQLMGTDPIVQNQPAMAEFIKWFEGELNEDISGALASLYGGATAEPTVGSAALQRDSALGRINSAWLAVQDMFAECHRQAIKCAALNRQKDVDEIVPGVGRITLEIAKMRGNVLCYPEYDASFPETSSQKLLRYDELWKAAEGNPNGPSAKILNVPKNLKVAKDVLRFAELEIPGAMEYEKQQGEFEILIKTGPIPNPELQKLKDQILEHHMQIMSATKGMSDQINQGTHDPNEMQQAAPQLDQMEQQVEMMAQKIKQLEKDAPLTSTVPIAQDKSENHAIEAAAVYDWMNSPEGRRYHHGTPEEQDIFQNFYWHWKEHSDMDAKLNPQQPSLKSEGMSFSVPVDKMPGNVAQQILALGGINANPKDFQDKAEADTQQTIRQRTAPKVISKLTRS